METLLAPDWSTLFCFQYQRMGKDNDGCEWERRRGRIDAVQIHVGSLQLAHLVEIRGGIERVETYLLSMPQVAREEEEEK